MKKAGKLIIVTLLILFGLTAGAYFLLKGREGGPSNEFKSRMAKEQSDNQEDRAYQYDMPDKATVLATDGEDKNVLNFESNSVYQVSNSNEARARLDRLIKRTDADFDNPIIAKNPFGTMENSFYFYFHTSFRCMVRYTITVDDETISDHIRYVNNGQENNLAKEHEFLVGISIDGPQELHDRYRRSNSGNGTFAKVIAAIERLKSYQVEFNTLTVINNVNVHYPLEVYHFLKSIGSKHMQFIELLETGTPNIDFSGHSENTFRIIDFSVPPTAYGKFMSTIFMQWVKNDVGEIFIRQFESFVSRFLGNGHTSCIFQESCKDNLVVESNGDIYECDHFVYPQYKIGNINKSELKTMNSVQLTAQKKRISAKCQQCAYKPICNGGCPKHRITKVNNETVSYFCEGYKILFSTMVPYMNAMVELAKNRVPLYHIMDVAKQMENN